MRIRDRSERDGIDPPTRATRTTRRRTGASRSRCTPSSRSEIGAIVAQSFRELMILRNNPPPMLRRGLGVLGILFVVFVWWLLTRGASAETRIISPVLLPSPGTLLTTSPGLF